MIIKYVHNHQNGTTTEAFVDSALQGKHREHCLCYRDCQNFKPGQPDNCEIAESNYAQALKFGIVTPVYECPKYEPKTWKTTFTEKDVDSGVRPSYSC